MLAYKEIEMYLNLSMSAVLTISGLNDGYLINFYAQSYSFLSIIIDASQLKSYRELGGILYRNLFPFEKIESNKKINTKFLLYLHTKPLFNVLIYISNIKFKKN